MAGLEAFAFAAHEALSLVTCPLDPEQRRAFVRLFTYVTKTAAIAVAVAEIGDRFVQELGRIVHRDASAT